MITITTTKNDPRYKQDSVAVELKHTFRKEQLEHIITRAADIYGPRFVLETLFKMQKDPIMTGVMENFVQQVFRPSSNFSDLFVRMYGLKPKKPATSVSEPDSAKPRVPDFSVGQFMVSVDGAKAPKALHRSLPEAEQEADRLLKSLPPAQTVRVLQVLDVKRSRIRNRVVRETIYE